MHIMVSYRIFSTLLSTWVTLVTVILQRMLRFADCTMILNIDTQTCGESTPYFGYFQAGTPRIRVH